MSLHCLFVFFSALRKDCSLSEVRTWTTLDRVVSDQTQMRASPVHYSGSCLFWSTRVKDLSALIIVHCSARLRARLGTPSRRNKVPALCSARTQTTAHTTTGSFFFSFFCRVQLAASKRRANSPNRWAQLCIYDALLAYFASTVIGAPSLRGAIF